MALKNFYAILGVGSNATREEIKLAYRRLAKRFHPDRNPGNKEIEERFKEISEAYNTLSDEHSRSKYDLKFLYTTNAQTERRYSTGTSHDRPRFRVKKERPDTAAEKRATRLIFGTVLVFVVTIIVMIIVNPEDEETTQVKQMMSQLGTTNEVPKKEEQPPPIMDADSPYDKIFGEGISVMESRNTITLINSETSEVVVCLVESGPPGRTIRNEYFGPGLTYKMVGIPNGKYYLKVYSGKGWNPGKKLADGKVTGGFEKEIGFFRSDTGKSLFEISQRNVGDNLVYSNYEIQLKKILNEKRRITEEEFFK
jgi:hypothetical protein